MPTWALAFSVALLVALATVSQCRRLALNIGFVDVPDRRKSHKDPIPYMGGVGLILGVIGGLVFEYPIGSKVTLIALAATLLGTIGLLDDDRTVSPGYRSLAEVAAAAAATAAGLRVHATGIEVFDFGLTILWIVGITNALNLMDNMDGLAAGLTSVAATAVFALAVASGQPVVATLSAATVGACLGFLVFNSPPASIFMGDAGSLFLGFVLAVITIDVDVALPAPKGFLIPFLILAIPVLDTTTVTLARLRRRRGVLQGGKDHLSHRLVMRGHSRTGAVKILLVCEAALALLAVLAGRDVVPLPLALVGSAAIVAALAFRAVPAQVYDEPVLGLPRRLRLALVAVAVGLPVLAAPAVIAMFRASSQARAGADAAIAALAAIERGDAPAAADRFEVARVALAEADDRLDGPLISAGLVVPGVASNLRAAQALVSIGSQLSEQGKLLADAYVAQSIQITGQSVPVDDIRRLAPLLRDADALLKRSRERLAAVETGFVVPALSEAVEDSLVRLDRQRTRTGGAVQMANVLPDVLGASGPRRYFLAFQNNAELRGSGGFLGNWGELVADDGQLRLTRFGRLDELIDAAHQPLTLEGEDEFLRRWREFGVPTEWPQVNVSPDFPTTAAVISQLYPQSGGSPVDGVIGIDPFGLAALLRLTGPVTVDNWPEPISSANVVDVTLRGAYERFRQDVRIEFLGDVARAVTDALTRTSIGTPTALGAALGPAVDEQHIKVWLSRPGEQSLMELLGLDGALGPVVGDSLLVVDQNLAANKIDYYLQRTVAYDVRLQPKAGSRNAKLDSRVLVTLENAAPPGGLPTIVIGPYDQRFKAGENVTHLSVYSPFALLGATVNGAPTTTTSDSDLGRSAHSLTVSVPAQQAISVNMDLQGKARLSDDGWYRLDLLRQPSVKPDRVSASVTVPKGWRIAEARGAKVTGPGSRQAVFEGSAPAPRTIWVRVERTGLGRIWDKLARAG